MRNDIAVTKGMTAQTRLDETWNFFWKLVSLHEKLAMRWVFRSRRDSSSHEMRAKNRDMR